VEINGSGKEKFNLLEEKLLFPAMEDLPLTHVPFSVKTSYRLNEHEIGVRVSGEAKCLFLLLHMNKGRWVKLGFCPVNFIAFMLCGKAAKGQI
jgi:hypothetical protein